VIACFEYDIETTDGDRRWARIQGNGGLLGSGCAYAYQSRPEATLEHLLGNARDRATRGPLSEWLTWDAPPAERFRDVMVSAVHGVRAVGVGS
jgi:hypothetical protein